MLHTKFTSQVFLKYLPDSIIIIASLQDRLYMESMLQILQDTTIS